MTKPLFDSLMVDLETLSTQPNAVITAIAAVPFNSTSWKYSKKEAFYKIIDIQSCLDAGLEVEGSTIYWWLQQSKTARQALFGTKDNPKISLSHALFLFTKYIEDNLTSPTYIWGNGASFDLSILANAYNKLNKEIPWNYRNERDVRTLVHIKPEIKKSTAKYGTMHIAVDDCINQIKYCKNIWRSLC